MPKAPWLEDFELPSYEPLDRDLEVDVCIVGAGVAGLSIAYELALRGRNVAVLDRAGLASGATSRSTAHLGPVLDVGYAELERLHGSEGARLAAESHAAAVDRIERTVAVEGIRCGFERAPGYLFAPPEESGEILEREIEAARRAGLVAEMVPRAPLAGFDTGRAIRFPGQAQIDPARYAAGLAHAIARRRGRVHGGTQALTIEGGERAIIATAEGPIVRASTVVVATNAPVNNLVSLHAKQAPYRTYVLAAGIPKGSVPRGLYWDASSPRHYVRIDPSREEQDVLVVGGEDHKTGHEAHPEERWRTLEAWVRSRFPEADRIGARWSGQIMQSCDGLAFIGKNPMDAENVLVVTGDSGSGVTHGAIAGMLLADLAVGRTNPWRELYDPSRVTLRASAELIKQNLDVVQQYTGWLDVGDARDEEEVPSGSGAVVRRGVHMLAVYRDGRGALHRCRAACPHLGGIVRWNEAEKSWDCPCHGSRFDPFGKVVRGPANADLEPVADPGAGTVEALVVFDPLLGARSTG
jgi:glycine/D-amino acid oxidase-like deaminating enzyme/nitrite reductase/ring-hydroxylating ferredoxin subunit